MCAVLRILNPTLWLVNHHALYAGRDDKNWTYCRNLLERSCVRSYKQERIFASRNSLAKTVPLARKKLKDVRQWYALHFQRKNRAHQGMEFKSHTTVNSKISHYVILYTSMPTSMNDYWNYMFKTIWFTKIVEAYLGENILLEAQIHEHFFNKMAMQYLVSTGHTIS